MKINFLAFIVILPYIWLSYNTVRCPLTMEDDGTYEASDGSGRNSSRKNSIEEALGESVGFWRKARNCQAAACV